MPLSESARPFAALAALAVLYSLLAFLRLRAVARSVTRAAPAPAPIGRRCGAARHRRRLRRRVAARAGDPRRFHPAGGCATGLRRLLPAALSQPNPAQDPDRGRRQRPQRVEQTHRADAGRERRRQSGDPRRHVAASARGARPRRGLRRGRHPARDRARRAQGHHRPYSDLRRCHLPVHLQNLGQRYRSRDQHAVLRARGWRRAHGRQPGQGDARVGESGRHSAAADLQPGRRLWQLHRAGGLRADPAADAAGRRVAADGGRAGAAGRWSIRERARPRRRAPDHLSAGARALFHRAAALLRIFHAWPAAAIVCARFAIRPRDKLHGPGGRRLVQAPGDPDPDLPRHQPAAAIPDGFLLAARGDPQVGAGRGLHLPVGFRDRRHRSHQSAGRQPCGRWFAIGAGSGASRSSISRSR